MINVTGRGNWIEGTDGSDNLVGTNDSENIHGNGGGDVIEGLGGADVLYGDDNTNTHNDTVSYAHSPAGVQIDLTQFPQHGGDAVALAPQFADSATAYRAPVSLRRTAQRCCRRSHCAASISSCRKP